MKNKLVFRIIGAIASALIVVSVFVPFVSVTGYSQSLWQTYEAIGALYLPIMILVFGAVGVVVFSTNIKTEFAYTSTGALVFFLLTQTIPIIKEGTLETLGVGYYFLLVGTILTGVMAFLCNLRVKKVLEQQNVQTNKEAAVLEQINKLYDNQTPITNVQENVVEPVMSQSMVSNNVNPVPVQPIIDPVQVANNPVSMAPIPEISEVTEPINPSIQGLGVVESDNKVVQENPVILDFNQPTIAQPTLNQDSFNNNVQSSVPNPGFTDMNVNPVVSEFVNSNSSMVQPQSIMPQEQQMVQQPIMAQEQPMIQPSNNANQANNNSNLDIFG